MPKRTTEMWHFPKRSSIEQMKGVLEILLDERMDFDGKPWVKGRIETFNTELAKRGLTESGAPLSPSGRRTLEALLKYFGLIYVDSQAMRVTEVGHDFVRQPKTTFTLQMLKLQITNPVIIEDCSGIHVFPFRATLGLLLDPRLNGFLSLSEIGYILFMHMKQESDFEKIATQIADFRSKSSGAREKELDAFKSTPEGKVVLAKAPSVNYYASLCVSTGLCCRNRDNLIINSGKEREARELLLKFAAARTYDFGKNLELWIDYYGAPKRLFPPCDVSIKFN
jgi:hypothetical protein